MIKPIETKYNGYRFRSRLEARWAVFFDALKIRYQYEVEGFDIDGVRYLPDFYLPDHNVWLEIKPSIFDSAKLPTTKYARFSEAVEAKFLVIIGIPRKNEYKIYPLNIEYTEYLDDDSCEFALARRSTKPELCLLGEWGACNLSENITDDGERWPITDEVEMAYFQASQERFVGEDIP